MNDDPISGAFEPFGKEYDAHVPVRRGRVAELEERVRVLEAFVTAYDNWYATDAFSSEAIDAGLIVDRARERVGKVSP